MKPNDLAALLTPAELDAVRRAVADDVEANPVWKPEAAEVLSDAIRAGDGDETRAMRHALIGAAALLQCRTTGDALREARG
jgi:hypothetical protein